MKLMQSRILLSISGLLLLLFLLLLVDNICYAQNLPVKIDIQDGTGTLYVDQQKVPLGNMGAPTALQFADHDPVMHEYQLDGTDSTNNFTLDTTYLNQISSSPYYRFQAWMRDLDGTSHWHNLQILADKQPVKRIDQPTDGESVPLPISSPLHIQLQLQRPETTKEIDFNGSHGLLLSVTLNRNDRLIAVTHFASGAIISSSKTYFPQDALPFAAMVIDFLVRTLLWSLLAFGIVLVGELGLVFTPRSLTSIRHSIARSMTWVRARCTIGDSSRLFKALHPTALVALTASLLFVTWIAYVQYHAEPHIYDASAYFFAAKMYAIGQLSVPVPPAVDRFPGGFMILFAGRWFGQYAPGTALTLVPGIWLGIPWLVEPILGTLALLGIGLIAARLYDRHVATLAVILGTLSPFYSYLAASYLSHTVALFYLVWGIWALLRFVQGEAGWNLPLSAICFGMAALTRDQVTTLFVAIMLPGIVMLSWRRLRLNRGRLIVPGTLFITVGVFFICVTLLFNYALSGNTMISPRSLFFAGDHWGFGLGVGFYGEHTLAAGLVNLDELLTILAIDLFGWPFYLTLAFIALPFLTWQAKGADWLLLVGLVMMTGAYIGYFYHGIYLGPRYLFETLPFLLILSARGILALSTRALETAQSLRRRLASRRQTTDPARISITTVTLVVGLMLCNVLYFMPRQIELHRDYTGLPIGDHLDFAALYHPPLHNAIIVTDNYAIYQLELFPLNDPLLRGDVLYAEGSNQADYAELHKAFPGRNLYRLDISADGSVHYVQMNT